MASSLRNVQGKVKNAATYAVFEIFDDEESAVTALAPELKPPFESILRH